VCAPGLWMSLFYCKNTYILYTCTTLQQCSAVHPQTKLPQTNFRLHGCLNGAKLVCKAGLSVLSGAVVGEIQGVAVLA